MKKFAFARRGVLLTTLFAGLAATSALAQEARVSIPSNKSFEQTVDAFKMAVGKGGMMVMSTVDQGNMLKMTGLELKGTLFLRQHVELLIKHAGRLVDARVVEGLEHHGGLGK
jgi:hypothetical protein